MIRLVALLALACSLGCRDGAPPNESKRMPKAPPPATVVLPSELRIEVVIAGQPREPITAASLAKVPADFTDADHRAWKIASLVGPEAAQPGMTISATSAQAVTIELRSTDQLVPALFVTRRGEIIAAVIDPRDPFPDYHGQGRRLGRPGDPLPRISAVAKIEVSRKPPIP